MEGQAAPGAGGGEEPLSSGRMNPKRSGRVAEEESRNKPKLVSELWGWEGGQGTAWGRGGRRGRRRRRRLGCRPVAPPGEDLGRRGVRPGLRGAGLWGIKVSFKKRNKSCELP